MRSSPRFGVNSREKAGARGAGTVQEGKLQGGENRNHHGWISPSPSVPTKPLSTSSSPPGALGEGSRCPLRSTCGSQKERGNKKKKEKAVIRHVSAARRPAQPCAGGATCPPCAKPAPQHASGSWGTPGHPGGTGSSAALKPSPERAEISLPLPKLLGPQEFGTRAGDLPKGHRNTPR